MTNPFLGIVLHAIGGLAAASFYLPFKGVRKWSWESYWLVGGFFSWIIAPWIVGLLTVPELWEVLKAAPTKNLLQCYLFGALWGIGGLTFGLSVRYLGMSLGYALALGFCAAFGTLVPPLVARELGEIVSSTAGLVTLGGIAICLVGIAICGWAGVAKERKLAQEGQEETIREFSLLKGFAVAVFAGILSGCMALGIKSGKPIAAIAVDLDTPKLWENSPVFIVILAGGFTVNLIWCLVLNWRNRSAGDYINRGRLSSVVFAANYLLSATAGVTWYLQFMFYGMGTTKLGKDYDFSSWSIHMAFIIVFSNLWGLALREWRGAGRRAVNRILTGLVVLILSTIVIGGGNFLKEKEKKKQELSEPPVSTQQTTPVDPGTSPPVDAGGGA
ncbi:MAG: L-rhamnose/proton symporter RhaT [Pirellulales bacterium]|nr:L-rhamnose/proton symporter RhaT [Pirellulales bacterium]